MKFTYEDAQKIGGENRLLPEGLYTVALTEYRANQFNQSDVDLFFEVQKGDFAGTKVIRTMRQDKEKHGDVLSGFDPRPFMKMAWATQMAEGEVDLKGILEYCKNKKFNVEITQYTYQGQDGTDKTKNVINLARSTTQPYMEATENPFETTPAQEDNSDVPF